MKTFRMTIAFDGTAYHGWQRQPNGISVQELVEDCLFKMYGERQVRIQGSSRTDAGVHSLGLTASFSSPPDRDVPEWKILKTLNRILPPDIRVRDIAEVPESFNARFSALGKSYVYVINSGGVNPFTNRWSWNLHDFQNLDAVRSALKFLEGKHDFSSFSVESKKYADPVRTILKAELYECGSLKCVHFIGDGFLYKMVRGMIGVLADIGRNKIQPEEIPGMFEAKNRCAARDTAPACGLFLMKVFYTPDEWKTFHIAEPPWVAFMN